MSELILRNISKSFGNAPAVNDVTLEIRSGEFFSILGPSGCGKTTLLRMIAGFETPSAGEIVLAGKSLTHVRAQHRNIGLVFQNYALFPHMTVFENVAFGLETKRVPVSVVREKVGRVLDAVNLRHKERSGVTTLSGGEQQRVAVARAIVVEPSVLLFDEPLSNLDVALRLRTREEIRSLQRKTGITTVYVTHDQSEAMSLSDRLAVMNAGHLEQVGPPAELYEHPASPFVAQFLGGANLLEGRVGSHGTVEIGGLVLRVPDGLIPQGRAAVRLAVKPEGILLNAMPDNAFEARVEEVEYLGFTTGMLLGAAGIQLRVLTLSTDATRNLYVGSTVQCSIDWSRCSVFPVT